MVEDMKYQYEEERDKKTKDAEVEYTFSNWLLKHSKEMVLVALYIVAMFSLALVTITLNDKEEDRPLQIWVVKCSDGLVEYIAPYRIAVEQEKALCHEPEEKL